MWAEVKESQERTLKDEWNLERIKMAGDVLRDVHVLICIAYEYVKWLKMYFANVTKLGIWRWGHFPGLSEGAQCHRRVLIRGRQENQCEE